MRTASADVLACVREADLMRSPLIMHIFHRAPLSNFDVARPIFYVMFLCLLLASYNIFHCVSEINALGYLVVFSWLP